MRSASRRGIAATWSTAASTSASTGAGADGSWRRAVDVFNPDQPSGEQPQRKEPS